MLSAKILDVDSKLWNCPALTCRGRMSSNSLAETKTVPPQWKCWDVASYDTIFAEDFRILWAANLAAEHFSCVSWLVSSPPMSAPQLRRSVVASGPRLAPSRVSNGYAGSTAGSDLVADHIEKQGAVQRGQEKSLQQLNAKV